MFIKFNHNLLRLSHYFNQHMHWKTVQSKKTTVVNGWAGVKVTKFQPNKNNFY
jgi:hypothetical protein